MHRIAVQLHRGGGVARTRELRAAGFTTRQLRDAVSVGIIRRVRIGWYATQAITDDDIKAMRIGGMLTCVSAAREYGFDVPPGGGLHVALPGGASRLRTAHSGFVRAEAPDLAGMTLHWTAGERLPSRCRTDVTDTLKNVLLCQPTDWAVACLDSALRRSALSPDVGLAELRAALPESRRAVLDLTDARSESCIESLTRVRLRALGLNPVLQVVVARGVRVDMVLKDRLIIELDGSEYHAGPAAFEADRARDAVLNALGYRVLHFSYRQIVHDWPTVESTIRMVLRQAPPR